MVLCLAVLHVALGCTLNNQVKLRRQPHPKFFPAKLLAASGELPSERTQQFLRRYGLEKAWKKEEPRVFLRRVQDLLQQDPSDEKLFAASELAFLAARSIERENPELGLDLYGASVIHAFQYLFDDRFRNFRNPYDPTFRGACDLYNKSLEQMLRIICRQHGFRPGQTYRLHTPSGVWELQCRIASGLWQPEEFGHFEFANDYQIRNLRNHYRTYGLGVPLIAVRRPLPQEPPAARFYPDHLSFPVTVFLRPEPGADPYASDVFRRRWGVLELYDPLVNEDIRVGSLWVPLQTDLTTPLAYFLADPRMAELPTVGLFRPEKLLVLEPGRGKPLMGLYMLQPYEPGKIPVVMIHGLWSGPMTWVEMFNDLLSLPEIRRHFQFWFYLYPTAQPFWVTAAALRADLAEVRQVLDPQRQEPALDQMVLVGHSMGGLLARLQTVDSGDRLWRLISDAPFEAIRADPVLRAKMAQVLFFRANPSVARAIFIATPHRGSPASNLTTQWILERLIELPEFVVAAHAEFSRNNRDLIRDPRLLRIDTSIEALDPRSPFFDALEACPKASWVRWHNIVGLLPQRSLVGRIAAGSDGVVNYTSAHLEQADTELVVPADHLTIHTHPQVVQEVRRILLEHLLEVQTRLVPAPLSPPFARSNPLQSLPGGESLRVLKAVYRGSDEPSGAHPPAQAAGWWPQENTAAFGQLPALILGPSSPWAPPSPAASWPDEPPLQSTASGAGSSPLPPSPGQGIPWAVGADLLRR
jgi:pimeloyl-ACP methyl ester carboxylesterase